MGELIGGILGGVGSVAGAVIQSQAADRARQDALLGYNYLTSGGGSQYINGAVNGGTLANQARDQLLGLTTATPGTESAFDNYLKSTGYKFQLGQGIDAITSSAAARGTLNSGGTLKALTEYGQGLAGQSFNNYLANLGNAGTAGYNAVTAVGNAGTGAGSGAAQYTAAGGNAVSNGVTGAIGGFGGALTNALARGGSILGGGGTNL